MTARVFVNRLWHQFYGRGISDTLVDSGNQGDWPSHPDLLDWLAAEFIESGWDVRHMIRLMVSTDAYRLSSVPDPKTQEIDPKNRLITRQLPHRLDAEEIRDTALAAAGVLRKTEAIPARSFFPYQPDAYWEQSNKIMLGSRYQIWETAQGRRPAPAQPLHLLETPEPASFDARLRRTDPAGMHGSTRRHQLARPSPGPAQRPHLHRGLPPARPPRDHVRTGREDPFHESLPLRPAARTLAA